MCRAECVSIQRDACAAVAVGRVLEARSGSRVEHSFSDTLFYGWEIFVTFAKVHSVAVACSGRVEVLGVG